MFVSFRAQPVTIALTVAAMSSTLWWWCGGNVDVFLLDARAFWEEPWRLLSSVLPHANVVHLVFNIYWLALFGGRIEEDFGSLRTAVIYLGLALGSSTAEYAFLEAGIGLSGIVFGLFSFLWTVQRTDSRFSDLITPRIVLLFVVTFWVCIALTLAGIWKIGNLSHAVGMLLGMLFARAIVAEPRQRFFARVTVMGCLALFLIAAILRPYVNLASTSTKQIHRSRLPPNFFGRSLLECRHGFTVALKRDGQDAWPSSRQHGDDLEIRFTCSNDEDQSNTKSAMV